MPGNRCGSGQHREACQTLSFGGIQPDTHRRWLRQGCKEPFTRFQAQQPLHLIYKWVWKHIERTLRGQMTRQKFDESIETRKSCLNLGKKEPQRCTQTRLFSS